MVQSPELQVAIAKGQLDCLRSEFARVRTPESLDAYKKAAMSWAIKAAALDKTREERMHRDEGAI